jgi:poly(3-hydroxybutyrate) depolymerase
MKKFPLTALAAALSALAIPTSAGSLATLDVVRGTDGEVLGTEDELDLALGGSFSNPFAPPTRAQATRRSVFEITLTNTGTGWDEPFLLGIPVAAGSDAPLLVVFHGYARTHNAILSETSYFRDAMARGWYVLAPLGAHKFNYGIPYAQENIAAALTWAAKTLPLDLDRIYGVGFSMGGGVVTSFAARHVSPLGPRFAAIVNHTGTVSLRNEYFNVFDQSLFNNSLMFGGSPNQFPFAYQQASAIDVDEIDQTIDPDSDFARNLAGLPIRNWAVAGDPLAHLVDQIQQFDSHVGSRGSNSTITIGSGNEHSWDSLAEDSVLDYLSQFTRQELPAGVTHNTIADRDGRFFHFDLEQASSGGFTSFSWNVQTGLNRVYLFGAKNLARASLLAGDMGLDVTLPFEIVVGNKDGLALDIVLRGYAAPPSAVLRGGRATGSWSHDAQAETVTLFETNAATFPLWRVEP